MNFCFKYLKPETYFVVSTKILSSKDVFNINNNKKYFLSNCYTTCKGC